MNRLFITFSLVILLLVTSYAFTTGKILAAEKHLASASRPVLSPATPLSITFTTYLPIVFKSDIPSIPSGSITLYALGDSLTAGDGDDSPQGGGYPRRLISQIQTPRPGSTATNLGQSGWTSENLINGFGGVPSQLDQAVAAHPAIACVWIGSNDLWYLYEYNNPSVADENLDLQNFTLNIEVILSRLNGAGVATFIALLDDQSQRPVATSGAFPGISAAERARMSQQVIRYNQAITNKAAAYNATVVDFYHTTIFTNPATLADDGNHPNAAGYNQITQIWYNAINAQLN